ncbi:MAG: GTP cyclohydrolase II [Spirochaetaceae bacterium]|nr:GTP cyclohydrolase II [Spirochaetaceae bacterium]
MSDHRTSAQRLKTAPGTAGGRAGQVRRVAHAAFPTLFGDFTLIGFEDSEGGTELTAVVRGQVRGAHDCPVRVHSECHTGDIFGSLRCDCREQLEESLRYIAARDRGAVIYLRQEGRGIGLLNKIRAYELQDQGLDSVEANERLGFPADARDYRTAARVIELLGIASVRLLTNNPAKIAGLEREGITVTARVPVVVPANRFNERYLATKRTRFNHLL